MSELRQGKKITSGLIWTFGERITAQLVSTLVTILLARILDPDHYGIISIVTIFISFCNIFVASGFCSAIVRKPSVSEVDYNTAFFVSLLTAIILYIILFFLSPAISQFYNMPELIAVTRVMALRLPMAALNSIQQAHIQREMAFKRFFVATLFGTVISGVVGIAMARSGYGVWALVAQYLTNTTVDSIVLWFVGGWTPRWQFSSESVKEIFSFGWKVLASEVVATSQNDIRGLVIGKCFGATDLAFFDQGKKYPSILVTNVNTAINKVMLPAYARIQDDSEQLKSLLRRSIQIGLFIIMPIMIGFMAVSDTFVSVVLTDKWLKCVPFLQVFCLCYLTRPLEASCQQAILAIGRSDIILKVMLMINIPSIIFLIITAIILNDLQILAYSLIISMMISFGCYMFYSNKLIGYSFKEQFHDLLSPTIASFLMWITVFFIGKLSLSKPTLLIIQVISGVLVYLCMAKVLKIPAMNIVVKQIRAKKNNNQN